MGRGPPTALPIRLPLAHSAQGCQKRGRSKRLVQNGREGSQRFGQVRVARNNEHLDATFVQPIHQRVSHLALEIDITIASFGLCSATKHCASCTVATGPETIIPVFSNSSERAS